MRASKSAESRTRPDARRQAEEITERSSNIMFVARESPQGRSLDELKAAYDKEVGAGRENLAEAISIGFQYRVAKAQERWARVSACIAGASMIVAIAAVVVAAIK